MIEVNFQLNLFKMPIETMHTPSSHGTARSSWERELAASKSQARRAILTCTSVRVALAWATAI
jgi:hypothetical protein